MSFALSCIICNQAFTFFENLTHRALQRCTACDQRLREFQENTLMWIEQTFQEPNGISAEIEEVIYDQLQALQVPPDLEEPVTSRLRYTRNLSKIRLGDFPHIRTAILLDTDEYAHFEVPATFFRKGGKEVPGRLIGTTKRLYFSSDSGKGGAKISLNNISEVRETTLMVQGNGYHTAHQVIRIHVLAGAGGGDYAVPDTLYCQTIIEALGKQWRRQLGEKRITSGYVPDVIKALVHQRDGGHCVECGYEGPYLEYDHKVPRSKGGPTTVDNIQLLCGICNRRKGDKL